MRRNLEFVLVYASRLRVAYVRHILSAVIFADQGYSGIYQETGKIIFRLRRIVYNFVTNDARGGDMI